MSFFWKLVDETQMSIPPKPAMHHHEIKLWSFYPSETFTLDHSQMRHPVIRYCYVWVVLQTVWFLEKDFQEILYMDVDKGGLFSDSFSL